MVYQKRVWVFKRYKTVTKRWPVTGQLKKEQRRIFSMKGQKSTKFRPPDKGMRNEGIMITWKCSMNAVYNILLCWSFQLGLSEYAVNHLRPHAILLGQPQLYLLNLFRNRHIMHCTSKWYLLYLPDRWEALLYVYCSLMFWYVKWFPNKTVYKK